VIEHSVAVGIGEPMWMWKIAGIFIAAKMRADAAKF
jgi:hypothetical protein